MIRRLLLLLLVVASVGSGLVAGATPVLAATPPALDHLGSATRALIVTGRTASSDSGTATAWTKVGGSWQVARGGMSVHLGRNGFRSASSRHEGDGTTPAGKFHLRYAFGSAPNPGARLRWKNLVPQSCWSGERADYNRWVHRTCTAADEDLYAARRTAYRYVVAVGFNDNPAVYGRGSAIFLHQSIGVATSGCVSFAEADIRFLVQWITLDTWLVMGPESYVSHL